MQWRLFKDSSEDGLKFRDKIRYKDKLYVGEEDLWWYSPSSEEDGENGGEKERRRFKMVLTAIDDPVTSREVAVSCRRLGLMVNVADVPPLCDFYFGSLIRRGPLQILISTGGAGPRLAHRIKALIEKNLPQGSILEDAITNIGELRKGLRRIENGGEKEIIDRRMKWMIGVSDGWSFEELAKMTPDIRQKVLEGWESGRVVGWEEATGGWKALDGIKCPWKKEGKGKASRCPFLLLSTGFVAGLTVASTVAFVFGRLRLRR